MSARIMLQAYVLYLMHDIVSIIQQALRRDSEVAIPHYKLFIAQEAYSSLMLNTPTNPNLPFNGLFD